jgi:hypothetical protein
VVACGVGWDGVVDADLDVPVDVWEVHGGWVMGVDELLCIGVP